MLANQIKMNIQSLWDLMQVLHNKVPIPLRSAPMLEQAIRAHIPPQSVCMRDPILSRRFQLQWDIMLEQAIRERTQLQLENKQDPIDRESILLPLEQKQDIPRYLGMVWHSDTKQICTPTVCSIVRFRLVWQPDIPISKVVRFPLEVLRVQTLRA